MSERDLDIIRAGVAALNKRDLEGMLATLAEDVELVPLRAVLEGTVYRGHAGLRRWLEDMSEDWDDFRIDLHEVRDLGAERVLLLGRFHARGRSSGVQLDWPAAWICRMAAGKVARMRFYADAESALAEADAPAASGT
jgi:ketosteroid isomerase-like protein